MKVKILLLSVFFFFTAPVAVVLQLLYKYVSFCQKAAIEVLDEVYRVD